MDKIFKYIDDNRDRFIADLAKLVAQPSISSQKIGVDECAVMLKDMMDQRGVETSIRPMNDQAAGPVVFGRMDSPESDKTVLVYGHYDVQPPEPLELWNTPPFEPTIIDNKMFGRGTGDNKGQLLAQLLAVEAVNQAAGKLPINVKLIFDPEEEIGSPSLARWAAENKDLLAADYGYLSDGKIQSNGQPVISFGNRGLLYVEMTMTGPNRDLHSGHFAEAVENPNWRMIKLLQSMRDENGRVAIEGFYDNVPAPTGLDRAALDAIPMEEDEIIADLALARGLNLEPGQSFYEKICFSPTLNISGYASGYGGEGAKTILPSQTKVKIDMRLVKGQEPEDILNKFKAHLAKQGCDDVELKVFSAVPPQRTELDHPMAEAIDRAVRTAYQKEPVRIPSSGGTLPLSFFKTVLDIPLIVVPYANHDERNHSPNENLDLDLFILGIKTSAAVLFELAAL